jgi:hypothetical protein
VRFETLPGACSWPAGRQPSRAQIEVQHVFRGPWYRLVSGVASVEDDRTDMISVDFPIRVLPDIRSELDPGITMPTSIATPTSGESHRLLPAAALGDRELRGQEPPRRALRLSAGTNPTTDSQPCGDRSVVHRDHPRVVLKHPSAVSRGAIGGHRPSPLWTLKPTDTKQNIVVSPVAPARVQAIFHKIFVKKFLA